MYTLYHHWISPFARKVRQVLDEKKIECDLIVEKEWERRPEFLALNPAGEVPVLLRETDVLCGGQVIAEFLEEEHPNPQLIGSDTLVRAEVRRLCAWFDGKFFDEVAVYLIGEKVMKRLLGLGEPDSTAIRAGQKNIHIHMQYISYLVERRSFLASDNFSLADITAAAHLSCVDYLNDVPWNQYPDVKDWYAKIKSRPSFRGILGDHIPGLPPPRHYADLDF